MLQLLMGTLEQYVLLAMKEKETERERDYTLISLALLLMLQDTTITKHNQTKPNVAGTPLTDLRAQEEGSQVLMVRSNKNCYSFPTVLETNLKGT